MEQIGGATGVFWIALALVLAGLTVAASLRARHLGRAPGEGPLWLLSAVILIAFAFLIVRAIVAIDPELESNGEVPLLVPDWVLADSTALVAGIVAAVAAVAWIICFVIRGRALHRQAVAADEAVLQYMRREAGTE